MNIINSGSGSDLDQCSWNAFGKTMLHKQQLQDLNWPNLGAVDC